MIRENEDGTVTIDLWVQPRASRARIGGAHGARLKVAVTAPPVDGAANRAVVELFAKALHVPKSHIAVTGGHASRHKTLRVTGCGLANLKGLLR